MEIFKVPEEDFRSPKIDNNSFYDRRRTSENVNKDQEDPNKPSTAINLTMNKEDIISKKAFFFACGRNVDGELGLQPVGD